MPATYPVILCFPDGREVTLEVAEDTFIYDAAAAAGIRLPGRCLQGWCLTCAGRITEGSASCVDHRKAARYFPEDRHAGFVLLCTGKPLQACCIALGACDEMKAYRRCCGRPAPGR